MMTEESIKVSRDELLEFAKSVYKKALFGYSDLEEAVCSSEVNRLFSKVKSSEEVYFNAANSETYNLTISSDSSVSNSLVGWTTFSSYYQPESYFVGCNPSFNTLSSTQPNYGFSSPFSPPTDRQLLLFEEPDSINDGCLDTDSSRGVYSNEGHIYL